jgi:hypothetical protein
MHNASDQPKGDNMHEIDFRAIKAAAFGASTELTRPYLHGVNLQGDSRGIIATSTNGHLIIAMRASDKPVDPFDIIIPSDAIKSMKAGKPEATIRMGEEGMWHIQTDKGLFTFTPLDFTFPAWRRVMPSILKTRKLARYNPELLMTFVKAAKVFGLSPTSIEAWQNGENAAFVKIFNDYDQGFGVIMPFRGCMDYAPIVPEWAKELAQPKGAA